ncbi:MAG: dockerin type I repeat-containing protein [Clostridia bacterium]|nr:dockerin type I repeat-containing protein [Clostridia bacterium]
MNKRIIAILLSVLLMGVAAMPAMGAQTAHEQWTYDNSFLVTMERPHGQIYDGVFPENFSGATVIQKTVGETVDTYRVVYTTPNIEAWESLQQQLAASQGVTSVTRNSYASDYGKRASYVTLNHSEVRLMVGETMELRVTDQYLASNYGGPLIGVEFTVEPDAFETIEAGCFEEFGIGTFWAVPTDATKSDGIYPVYDRYSTEFEDMWFDESYRNAPSATHTYFGILQGVDESWGRGDMYQYRNVLHALACDARIGSVQPMYDLPAPTGARPYEWWEMTDPSVAQITAMVNTEDQPDWWSEELSTNPADHQECFFHKHSVTVKGMQAGNTVLKVTVGYENSCTVEIPVTVYSPDGYVFRAGDVDLDGTINAADALEVLKSVVGKVELNPMQQILADVNADSSVSASDALMILQRVVGKIDKFPCEE